LGKLYPALDITSPDSNRVLWIVDDFSPAAIDEHDGGLTIYFPTTDNRDGAVAALARDVPGAVVSTRDVDDEDWARRSQANLGPVVVGRVTIAPPWAVPIRPARPALPALPARPALPALVIEPSMGFGTGHHATTRLCVAALQRLDLRDAFLLDVGTGSGILALAGCVLGASAALGMDNDPDAIRCANDNLRLNPGLTGARFELGDLESAALPVADVVTANLTGALLVKTSGRLLASVRPAGILVVSGLREDEREDVRQAFGTQPASESDADGWVCMTFRV